MNQDDFPRPPPAQNSDTTPVIAANTQWNDAELALKMARRSYDRWLIAGGEDTRSPAIMHAYHTHEALNEAVRHHCAHRNVPCRAVALITIPAHGSDIPRPTAAT